MLYEQWTEGPEDRHANIDVQTACPIKSDSHIKFGSVKLIWEYSEGSKKIVWNTALKILVLVLGFLVFRSLSPVFI